MTVRKNGPLVVSNDKSVPMRHYIIIFTFYAKYRRSEFTYVIEFLSLFIQCNSGSTHTSIAQRSTLHRSYHHQGPPTLPTCTKALRSISFLPYTEHNQETSSHRSWSCSLTQLQASPSVDFLISCSLPAEWCPITPCCCPPARTREIQ